MSGNNCPQKNRLAPKFLSIAFVCVLFASSCEGGETGPEEIRSLQEQIASARADIEKIQTSSLQARAIEAWVSAANPIQPLIVAITRSMSAQSRLKRLQLARDADSPGRMTISFEVSSDDPKSQLESILKAVHDLGLREQSVTQTNSEEAIKFDAVLVWKDSDREGAVQVSADSLAQTSPDAGEDEPALRATLASLQVYARALTSQNVDALNFAAKWQPYFALTDEANLAEKGISLKLRVSELAVLRSSFKIVDCSPLYPGLSEAIPQILHGEVVIEDNFAKGINWLGMMESVKPTMRICSVSITSAGKDKCRFDLVLEVPLLKKSSN